MTARRHHFVSKCYLKSFAVPRKKKYQTVVFDAVSRKSYLSAIDNVALQRDFNRIEVQGVKPDEIEQFLAKFEDQLGPAIERIIAAASLDNRDDRAILLNFICMLSFRNPRFRETVRDFHEQIAKAIMNLTVATPERWEQSTKRAKLAGVREGEEWGTYEDMKAFVKKGDYKIVLPTERHVQLELDLFDKILGSFFKRRWLLLKAPRKSGSFITSDHPVCLMWSDPAERGNFYGPGLGMPGTYIFFPISPKLAMVGAFEIDDGEREISEINVAGFNGAIIAYAERQVYAHDANFQYLMQPNELPRKASKLIDDRRFRRPRDQEARSP